MTCYIFRYIFVNVFSSQIIVIGIHASMFETINFRELLADQCHTHSLWIHKRYNFMLIIYCLLIICLKFDLAGVKPRLSEAKTNLTTLQHGYDYVMSISNSTFREQFPTARYDSKSIRNTIKKSRRVMKQNKESKARVDRACAGVNETQRHLKEIPVMVASTLVPLTGGGGV